MLDHKQWLLDKLSTRSSASSAGWHYVQAFLVDPYAWYLRHIRRLEPTHTKPALTLGSGLHLAIEAAYLFDTNCAKKTFNDFMRVHRSDFESQELFNTTFTDGIAMLSKWLSTWPEHDKETYHILAVEQPFELPLPNGMAFTGRIDLIVQEKSSGIIRALDHKTSRYSLTGSHQSFADGDQPTAYLWALSQLYPNNIILGIESDILYKNKSVVKAERPGIVQRTPWYINEWLVSTTATMEEITRRVNMLDQGYPVAYCFPRNSYAEAYWKQGDWSGIYRSQLPDDINTPPDGYRISTGGNTNETD